MVEREGDEGSLAVKYTAANICSGDLEHLLYLAKLITKVTEPLKSKQACHWTNSSGNTEYKTSRSFP